MDDLLIKGALVYDGTGAEPAIKDVAVYAHKIRAVGQNLPENARQTIDGTGLALMPGIIDSHTHFDAQITWDATLKPSPALGVTTAVIGNCGFTIAPCKPADRDMTMRNLTQVEGMSLDVLKSGIDWGFETFAEYLAMLRGKGCVVNTAAAVTATFDGPAANVGGGSSAGGGGCTIAQAGTSDVLMPIIFLITIGTLIWRGRRRSS